MICALLGASDSNFLSNIHIPKKRPASQSELEDLQMVRKKGRQKALPGTSSTALSQAEKRPALDLSQAEGEKKIKVEIRVMAKSWCAWCTELGD